MILLSGSHTATNCFILTLPSMSIRHDQKPTKVIAYLNEREEFEIVQYRNVKDVQEITPLRGYSPQYEKYLAGRSLSLSEREKSKPYFDEWYRAQNP